MIPFRSTPQRRQRTGFALIAALSFMAAAHSFAQAGRIYTNPDPSATGVLNGRVAEPLTHAVAVERDRARVFRAALDASGRVFRFERLPIGKYDLVLFTQSGTVYEGLALGTFPQLTETSGKNFQQRVSLADGFFNKTQIHRAGLSADGETLLAFVERFRANDVLKQSGEALGQMVRRFEIIELTRAGDDWQMTSSRHIYREGEPVHPEFRKTVNLPALGNLRVIREPKDLGEIPLNPPPAPDKTGGIPPSHPPLLPPAIPAGFPWKSATSVEHLL